MTMIKILALAAACGGLAACAARHRATIGLGQTPEQVESVLGKPQRLYRRQTPGGDVEAWGYMPLWPGFSVPMEPIGSRGSLSTEIPLEPIRDDEDLRVFFREGKVVAIERRR